MSKIMMVRAPEELQRLLKDKSNDIGITRNALILQILWEWTKGDNKVAIQNERVS